MRRFHLLEIEDQRWCPRVVRDATTDFLAFMINTGKAYAEAVPILARLLRESGGARIVDLCSGGGGPWESVHPLLRAAGHDVPVRLTDLHPNARAFERASRTSEGRITGTEEPVDATRVPASLTGVRTIFTGFHHFAPPIATAVLRDAARARQPIAIFEATQRSATSLLVTLLSPILALLVTPMLRPVTAGRLVLTYLIPVIPLVILFDGIVSSLRTYTPDELRAMAAAVGADDYEWEAGETPTRGPIPITWLIGRPR